MKSLQKPLYNYSSSKLEFYLTDELCHPLSMVGDDSVFLVANRTLGSSSQLFNVRGIVLDSTAGHVCFDIQYTDSTHEQGPIFLEIRLRGSGVEKVLDQYEGYIAQSLSRSILSSFDSSRGYGTHVILTGDCVADITDQSVLYNYDLIFVDALAYSLLLEEHKKRAVLMFSVYGNSLYSADTEYNSIVILPSETGVPVQNLEGMYLYTLSPPFIYAFFLSIHEFLANNSDDVAGIMIDHCYPDIGKQWLLSNGDDTIVWPDRTDVGGDLVVDFYSEELETLEGLLRLSLDSVKPDGILVLAGTSRSLSSTKRMSRNLGISGPSGHEELLERLEGDSTAYPNHHVRSGDYLNISPYDSTGVFGQWVTNAYGSGVENFVRASFLASIAGCNLGVSFGQDPITGKTKYSLIANPSSPRWFHY